jgi:hypothetical protein
MELEMELAMMFAARSEDWQAQDAEDYSGDA